MKYRISLYSSATKILPMDARLLDVIIGMIAFLILIALLAILPLVITAGIAYLAAIIIFILFLSGAGYLVNEKIA
jgi:fatty acid desaturase